MAGGLAENHPGGAEPRSRVLGEGRSAAMLREGWEGDRRGLTEQLPLCAAAEWERAARRPRQPRLGLALRRWH